MPRMGCHRPHIFLIFINLNILSLSHNRVYLFLDTECIQLLAGFISYISNACVLTAAVCTAHLLESLQVCFYFLSNTNWVSRQFQKKKKQKQFIGNICLQSHYTECNPAEAETKALITWAAFWSCSAESGHTWGLSSFESISSLPWCSMMGNNYWRNVWLNRFISSLCFYFQKIRGSPVTWLEGKEMEILKHTCNSLFLLWWKGASVISYCTTGTYGQNQAGFT